MKNSVMEFHGPGKNVLADLSQADLFFIYLSIYLLYLGRFILILYPSSGSTIERSKKTHCPVHLWPVSRSWKQFAHLSDKLY